MPLVAPDHIESGTGRLLKTETAAEQAAISGKYLFECGDVVYSKIRPYLRKVYRATGPGLCSADMYPLRPNGELDSRFLHHLLLSEHFSRFAEIVSMRSGFPKLNRTELAEYDAAFPPLPEQRRIAEVLDTVDELIRKTEQIIAKLKQVKQGLLHDLLTLGIDDNLELRDPDRDPERFEDSPLGRVPRTWSVGPLGSVALIIDPNPSHRYPPEVEDGVPIASTENFLGTDDFDLKRSKRVPFATYEQQAARCAFATNDVVFARKGRIGFARRYGAARKVFSHTVVVMKPRSGTIPSFLLWVVRSERFFEGIRLRMNTNLGVPTLGVGFLSQVVVPIPPMKEQEMICERLDALQARIRTESGDLSKLRSLKAGLMEDLLTGRVSTRDSAP
ncbi:MAG: restriction endonuclease subunit S [Myxococcota bacterium]